jgi:hypothetical protein
MREFARTFPAWRDYRILDVGGNPAIWASIGAPPGIVYLNMPRAAEPTDDRLRLVFGDGTRLPFPDQSFDLVFSNSVIEHVGSSHAQRAFAREVLRVGRRYWVQTPNRWFPVEAHLWTPFVHWLPRSWQASIVPRATVWGALTRVTPDQREFFLRHYLDDIRLLTRRELTELFPDSELRAERVMGWAKSWVAVRR